MPTESCDIFPKDGHSRGQGFAASLLTVHVAMPHEPHHRIG